jgi:hypothetical protein
MARAKKTPKVQVDAFIDKASANVRPVLEDLRELVRKELPQAKEEIKWGRPVYSLNHIVCYLAESGDHANLGFYRGIELQDPKGLLEGEGKKLRHIKVYNREEIRRRWYGTLIRQAAKLDDD